ncbi:unnamed protein product [Adineta steineri]|uniref:Uncharacterized protein n=1 Tax=Adineta steineri TaxID=433720 RepID=A0A816C0D8_9BILA|nr:unnamed protein product [Adineta steineri]CAF1618377.1 unnamed protein product [Adineta steineri]
MSADLKELEKKVMDMDVEQALPIVQAEYPEYKILQESLSKGYHEIFYPDTLRLVLDDDNKVKQIILG